MYDASFAYEVLWTALLFLSVSGCCGMELEAKKLLKEVAKKAHSVGLPTDFQKLA